MIKRTYQPLSRDECNSWFSKDGCVVVWRFPPSSRCMLVDEDIFIVISASHERDVTDDELLLHFPPF